MLGGDTNDSQVFSFKSPFIRVNFIFLCLIYQSSAGPRTLLKNQEIPRKIPPQEPLFLRLRKSISRKMNLSKELGLAKLMLGLLAILYSSITKFSRVTFSAELLA